MIHALETLAKLPGVEMAMLSTADGVPIASFGSRSESAGGDAPSDGFNSGSNDALAAMALSWLGELQSSTAPLGWGDARRVLLRCARGSLLMERCRGAVLVIMLAPGVPSEELRLPMAGAVSRIERHNQTTAQEPSPEQPNPRGALPSVGEPAPIRESSETPKPHPEKA